MIKTWRGNVSRSGEVSNGPAWLPGNATWATPWTDIAVSVLCLALVSCGGPQEPTVPSEPPPVSETEVPPDGTVAPRASTQFTSDPELVRDLGAESSRERAVTQLVERFADVGKNGTKTPEALAFADAYAKPASQAYVEGYSALPTALRHKLLQTLLAFDHEATNLAFVHAIRSYATTGTGADDAIWACQGAARHKDSAFEQSLLEAYKAIDTSDKDGLRYSRHLATAMSVQRSDTWNRQFEQELNTPLVPPPRYDDKPAVRVYQSGLFRQTIATRLLGESNSDSAAETLLGVLLDSNKAEIHPAAELSLASLGSKAVPLLLALLNEQGPFVEPAKQARPDIKASTVYFATKWLDLVRAPETEADLLKAWSTTRDPVARTVIVRSLSRLPHSRGYRRAQDDVRSDRHQGDAPRGRKCARGAHGSSGSILRTQFGVVVARTHGTRPHRVDSSRRRVDDARTRHEPTRARARHRQSRSHSATLRRQRRDTCVPERQVTGAKLSRKQSVLPGRTHQRWHSV